jgi:hypothetical protein
MSLAQPKPKNKNPHQILSLKKTQTNPKTPQNEHKYHLRPNLTGFPQKLNFSKTTIKKAYQKRSDKLIFKTVAQNQIKTPIKNSTSSP